jgi:hypothetical protein
MIKFVEFHGYQKKVPKQTKKKKTMKEKQTQKMRKGNYEVHYYIFQLYNPLNLIPIIANVLIILLSTTFATC